METGYCKQQELYFLPLLNLSLLSLPLIVCVVCEAQDNTTQLRVIQVFFIVVFFSLGLRALLFICIYLHMSACQSQGWASSSLFLTFCDGVCHRVWTDLAGLAVHQASEIRLFLPPSTSDPHACNTDICLFTFSFYI